MFFALTKMQKRSVSLRQNKGTELAPFLSLSIVCDACDSLLGMKLGKQPD
jgi:hypothetical protein